MATVTALPSALREKLDAAAQHIRVRRTVRGISLVLLTMTISGGLALLADAWLELPALARAVLFLAWLGLGGVVVCAALVLPLVRELDPAALAAAVEEKYPDLGERLTSSVELADARDAYHGSPTLIGLLIRETEARANRLDFLRPFSAQSSRWFAVAAGVAVVAVLSPALVWPSRYAELSGRFLFPWRDRGPAAVPYVIEMTPGDTFAAKGRPLAIGANLRPLNETAALPQSSTLVITDADGRTSRQRMLADRADAFSLKLDKVAGDFSYRVEAGDAVSATHQVTAVDPVELAADSPTITVTPPAYAKATIQPQTLHGLADLSALQHSRVRFEFRFTQPAIKATLVQLPQDSNKQADDRRVVHSLDLSSEGRTAKLELTALFDSEYRLVLEGEHAIRTEPEPRSITVRIDQPPSFTRVSLGVKGASGKAATLDEIRNVLPYETVPIEVALDDDVGVDRAELEYSVNEGASQFEPIGLDGRGMRQATGRHVFKLAGKVKDSDTVRYRLKVADNRRVPEAALQPHVIYYPPAPRWLTLKITQQAEPLQQQEILAQHDEMNRRLEAIKSDLLREQRNLYKLRMESQEQQALKPEQAENLKQLRQDNRSIENALRDLARDTADNPILRPIADRTQEVADQEMQRSEKGLQQAEKETKNEPRDRELQKSDRELAKAIQRLEELQKTNERLAQSRQAQTKLEMTAQRQQELADRATEHAAKDPIKNPDSKADRDQLKREQQDIARDLQRLTEQSDPLRNALEAARAEEAKQLSERATELAKAQRDLALAARETEQRQREDELAKLANKQKELADQADRLAKKTKPAADATKTNPLKPEDARKAAEALQRADTREAMQRQEKAGKELDRLAADLDRAIEKAKQDAAKPAEQLSRQTAQELAKQQRELARATEKGQEDAKKQPGEPGKQALQKSLDRLAHQQKQLNERAGQLPAEQGKQALEQAKKEMTKAEQALANKDVDRAKRKQNEAADALERLAKQLPERSQPEKVSPEAKPNPQQTAEARQLAREQRELRDAVQRLANQQPQPRPAQENPVAELTKEQQAIAQKAAELAKNVGQEQGQQVPSSQQAKQAAKSAQRTANQMQAGNLPRAQESGKQTAQQLRQLSQQLQETPRGKSKPQAGEPTKEASQLAKRQEEVNRRLQQMARNTGAQQAQQQARQQDLQQQTAQLSRDLNQLAQQAGRSPQAQQAAQQATNSTRQAESAMQQAQQQNRQGNPHQAQQSQQQAAQALDRAAQQAAQASQQMTARQGSPQQAQARQTGQALQQAQGQMNQAQDQLAQNRPQSGQAAMQQAAQSLQQAAQQLAQQQQPPRGKPPQISSGNVGSGEGEPPDARMLPKDLQKYAGKRWGELPGELRTKIIQDMKAQYGDDYARIIKLYFEQIADTKAKKSNSQPRRGDGSDPQPRRGDGSDPQPRRGDGSDSQPRRGDGSDSQPRRGDGSDPQPRRGDGR